METWSYLLGLCSSRGKTHQEPSYHRCKVGLNHLAFHAKSRGHVDSITTDLRQRNIPILYEDLHPYAGGEHYYAVFIEDTDRMKAKLVAPQN